MLAICALPRIAALAVWHDPPVTHYAAIAGNLVEHGAYVLDGMPATFIEPLRPAVFASSRILFGSTPRAMLVLPIAVGGVWIVYRRAGFRLSAAAAPLTDACVAPWMIYSYAAGGAALPARIGENLFESTSEWGATVAARPRA